jgi:hypothetical protein
MTDVPGGVPMVDRDLRRRKILNWKLGCLKPKPKSVYDVDGSLIISSKFTVVTLVFIEA